MTTLQELTAVTPEDLATWYKLKEQLAQVKAAEAMLRGRIFKHYFPTPTEGTNTYDLKDGTGALLKATHVINRDVDKGELDALRSAISAEGSNLPALPLDSLIKWEPKLSITEYRKLSDADRAIFDRCLIVKLGSPQVKIEIPKKVKK